MSPFDRRITPFRPDLAASFLKDKVAAARYCEGRLFRVGAPSAPLRRAPQTDAPLDTEALAGQSVTVYDVADGWAWGQLKSDGYVGYLPLAMLAEHAPAPTHRVASLRSYLYPGPSIKLPPAGLISLGAEVAVTREEGPFAVLADGNLIWAAHLAPLGQYEPDFVAVAERFLHTPYLWGGKTSLGLDCSGLTQLALAAAGHLAPRDSDMLEASLGAPLPDIEDLSGLRRGDLVFWKGHVGIMTDSRTLLHANGHHMLVVAEPLEVARARIQAKSYGAITSIRRLG